MNDKQFEWDENKNSSNKEKHSVDFEFASSVFFDENRIEWQDNRKNYGEIRYITIGKIVNSIITVVYTLRDRIIRIISSRPAKNFERELYNNQNKTNED